jgi:hypothetical protein
MRKGLVRLSDPAGDGSVSAMATSSNPYRGFRFPAEVIEHAVWLYHCFSLSLRDVELILAARGIVVSYESIREWSLRFGRLFAGRRPEGIDLAVDHLPLLAGGHPSIADLFYRLPPPPAHDNLDPGGLSVN